MAAPRYDSESIRTLFDDMASTYGYVNLISSFGFTARWRNQAVRGLPLAAEQCVVVDLMSGMGELWRSLGRELPPSGRVVGVDISPEMTRRTSKKWRFSTEIQLEDILVWEPPPAIADVIVSSFGLKTFDLAQQKLLAQTVSRILKPGGSYSFIEISVPRFAPLRALFMFYVKRLIPLIGRLLLGNPDCYRMLGIYTEAFGSSAHFATCLEAAGLEVAETAYFFGCATGVRGRKPQVPLTPTGSSELPW